MTLCAVIVVKAAWLFDKTGIQTIIYCLTREKKYTNLNKNHQDLQRILQPLLGNDNERI